MIVLFLLLTFVAGTVVAAIGWRMARQIRSFSLRACVRAVLLATGVVPVIVPVPSLHGAFILPFYWAVPALLSDGRWDALLLAAGEWIVVFAFVWFVGYFASLDTARRKMTRRPPG